MAASKLAILAAASASSVGGHAAADVSPVSSASTAAELK